MLCVNHRPSGASGQWWLPVSIGPVAIQLSRLERVGTVTGAPSGKRRTVMVADVVRSGRRTRRLVIPRFRFWLQGWITVHGSAETVSKKAPGGDITSAIIEIS